MECDCKIGGDSAREVVVPCEGHRWWMEDNVRKTREALEQLVDALWDTALEIEPADHPANVAYMHAQKVLGMTPMRPRPNPEVKT